MSVELSSVLLSFFQDRLGSSFKVLPLLWDIPDIFPLTQTKWCDLVTFCTVPSAGFCSCFLTQPAPPSCPCPAPLFYCHQLIPSLTACPGSGSLFLKLLLLLLSLQVFLSHDLPQPALLFHSSFSTGSSLQSLCPPKQGQLYPIFPIPYFNFA